MSGEEAKLFEESPLFQMSLKMREWDEAAKEKDCILEPLEKYKQMALQILAWKFTILEASF